jgi:hypothetical protein
VNPPKRPTISNKRNAWFSIFRNEYKRPIKKHPITFTQNVAKGKPEGEILINNENP